MGSNSSKINTAAGPVQVQKNDSDLDANSDPRSPTPEIIRTPLQGKPGAKHNITKNVDLRKTFENTNGEEKLIHNNPILSAVIKNHLQSYDPRSPTQDFERTPIVISTKVDEITEERLPNEVNYGSPSLRQDEDEDENGIEATKSADLVVPKNLYDRLFDMTLDDTFKETEEPLGSSTASNEAIEVDISNGQSIMKEQRKPQLLETNFDYIDNEYENFEDSEEHIPSNYHDSKEELKHIPLFKILDVDPRSPSVGIERTPIVVTKTQAGDTRAENVEEMSDDTLIKVLQNTNAELRQNGIKPQDRKSDGLLIYEDETTDINDTPKKSKSASSSGGVRTPLSCMKNKDSSHTRSKSANTLFDPKTQTIVSTKIPTRVSHIPRLKSLSKQSKVIPSGSSISLKSISKASALAGDCENTPPHSHRDRWDKDNSIVL
ncbi:uncharacterized protein LOC128675328 [Plodia interpunctella]|uniref:uncharacterized protein LOC128675328 n=1 Tax=Plodia interpunctella TaxID=58824 RepID=UPI00236759E9|nr:uncharacterized protein LOC128675328 [Plodia interpunctella]